MPAKSTVFSIILALVPLTAAAQTGSTLIASSKVAVVDTEAGKVQGFVRDKIYTFRGLPYASAKRFMPPVKAEKWPALRQTLSYGTICPQPISPELREPQTFISDTRFWPQSENCQNLNIWSPGLDGKKRPVMVWLHGGGYFSGSSMEGPVYEGATLAAKGDVVVVSINHRLNVLGFLDLSGYGDAYKSSGNVGMLDIVAALEWVRDNIARFGGDPANVTIFGQSGGGGKVSTLLAAPSAHGLFQKAIIQSGIMGPPEPGGDPQKVTRRVAELTIRNAGLAPGDIAGLQALPYDKLAAASGQALMEVSKEVSPGATGPLGFPRVNWGPVIDGAFLTEKAFDRSAPAISADVPLLIGSTLNEFSRLPNPQTQGRENWGIEQVTGYMRKVHGDRADQIIAAYRSAYPEVAPREWPTIDIMGRVGALRAAGFKARQPAPVYNYLFTWQSPILDGFWGAGHSMELAFMFGNPELGLQSTGGGPAVARLTDQMSQAWIAFARSGNPDHPGMPHWPRYTEAGGATMLFDSPSAVRNKHDAALLTLLSAPPAR